jgi:alkylation response protein AidB-like acyl-CoA dehydrogenase
VTAAVTEDELTSLRESVRGFLGRYSPVGEVRRLMATSAGFDPGVWGSLASQLGVTGLTIPESFGGSGYGPVELAVVAQEAGRSLLCSPVLSSAVAATNVLLQAGSDAAKADLLPALACGELRATAAFAERGWDQGMRRPDTAALAFGDQWTVTGTKRQVLDGATAGLLLVTARTADGVRLFAVSADADGVARTEVRTMDQTRKMADVVFSEARASLVGPEADPGEQLRRATDLTVTALAAEQAGAAGRCVEMIVEYLKVREQFGRPLGMFQALKHRCANLVTEVECARAVAEAAAVAGALADWSLLTGLAGAAKVACSEAFAHASAECVQLHGGIGFTWEHDAHLYFKRARASQYLFGVPGWYREQVASAIGL